MGGWFRKEVKRVGDLKGLKMRVDGLAADMLALGVAPQQAALAELAQAAEGRPGGRGRLGRLR